MVYFYLKFLKFSCYPCLESFRHCDLLTVFSKVHCFWQNSFILVITGIIEESIHCIYFLYSRYNMHIHKHTYAQRQEMHFNNRSSFSYFCHRHKVNFSCRALLLTFSFRFFHFPTLKKSSNLCPGLFFLFDVTVLWPL